ncbi:hypothetical protein PTQ27_01235 [Mannheimia sp. AT1]|uniref:Uncharacterized protein n=1 Tax=Mannheimia cairinae TaxID=3025936 RepID=A0ABT5MM59_9PAST|nr:hypothetical protein [Mannheimia cairinae]MDD0823097.1 hypothetical protein [Mannheimia cairinae]MDD0825878.1 hypothetical protein [Mannheimia cairinae]
MSLENYIQQAEKMPFADKLNFILNLLNDSEIDELEAYRIFTAQGEPQPQESPECRGAFIDFLDD